MENFYRKSHNARLLLVYISRMGRLLLLPSLTWKEQKMKVTLALKKEILKSWPSSVCHSCLYLSLGLTHQWQRDGPVLSTFPRTSWRWKKMTTIFATGTAGCCCGWLEVQVICVSLGLSGTLFDLLTGLWDSDPGYYTCRKRQFISKWYFFFFF